MARFFRIYVFDFNRVKVSIALPLSDTWFRMRTHGAHTQDTAVLCGHIAPRLRNGLQTLREMYVSLEVIYHRDAPSTLGIAFRAVLLLRRISGGCGKRPARTGMKFHRLKRQFEVPQNFQVKAFIQSHKRINKTKKQIDRLCGVSCDDERVTNSAIARKQCIPSTYFQFFPTYLYSTVAAIPQLRRACVGTAP